MGRPKKEAGEALTEPLGLRVTTGDRARLEKLVGKAPNIPLMLVARTALRLGLDRLESDELLLLGGIRAKQK